MRLTLTISSRGLKSDAGELTTISQEEISLIKRLNIGLKAVWDWKSEWSSQKLSLI